MDLAYQNRGEVVAAEIAIGSAAQSNAKEVFEEFIEISESMFVQMPVEIEHINSQCIGRKSVVTSIDTEDMGMITTPRSWLNAEWKSGSLRLRHKGKLVDDVHAESVDDGTGGVDDNEKGGIRTRDLAERIWTKANMEMFKYPDR
jgi:hypothetical protein